MNQLAASENRHRILLVDDVPANLRALADLLAANYELQFATSGEEALTLLQQSPRPDLILLDIMMPRMDGYAVCRELKRSITTRHIPIIFISALDDKQDEIIGFEAGGADYIIKPFEPDIVMARVRHQLRLKLSFDALREASRRSSIKSSPNVFRLLQNSWEISFQGQPGFVLNDMLGLRYLHLLLLHPTRTFSVEEMVFLVHPKERDAILARDLPQRDEAELAYYRLLTETLVNQLHSPQINGLISGTLDQLLNELHCAGIFRGEVPAVIDDRERNRKSVGNAIRRAIKEIGEHDLALFNHLQFPNLRLGYELLYLPQSEPLWQGADHQ